MVQLESEDKTWGMLAHLAALIGIPLAMLGIPIPFTNILGPLVVWLAKRKDSEFVDTHGKESTNFQISVTIYSIVLVVIVAILGAILLFAIPGLLTAFTVAMENPETVDPNAIAETVSGGAAILVLVVGILMVLAAIALIVLGVGSFVLTILAAVKANQGQMYRYPLTFRLL